MTIQDIFVTPIYFLLLSLMAYAIRPYVTTQVDKEELLWFTSTPNFQIN